MSLSDTIRILEDISSGNRPLPSWISFSASELENGSADEQLEYVQSLADIWSMILSKTSPSDVNHATYKNMVEDIVSASEAVDTAYPLSIIDQDLVRLLPSNSRMWLLEYLDDRINSNHGDLRTVVRELRMDCAGIDNAD